MRTFPTIHAQQLQRLADHYQAFGGLVFVADRAECSSEYLQQVLYGRLLPAKRDGIREPRQLGRPTSRKIETKLNLGNGWLDRDEPVPGSAFAPRTADSPRIFGTSGAQGQSIREERKHYQRDPRETVTSLGNMLAGVDVTTRRGIMGLLSGLVDDPGLANRIGAQVELLVQGTKVSNL